MLKIWKYIQFLSLDVVLGAIVSSLFIAKTVGVSIDLSILIGLGIAIWLIYTADHLLDARAIEGKANNPRHAFHQRHFKLLIVLSIIAFSVGLWNMSFLRMETVKFGFVLTFCVGIYFLTIRLVQRKTLLHKEMSAAMIYSFGVFAGPLSITYDVGYSIGFLFLQFLVIVLLNLMIFPLYEIETDRQDQMNSIVVTLGERKVRRLINLFLTIAIVLSAIGLFGFSGFWSMNQWYTAQYVFLVMITMLIGLALWPEYFKKNGLYRILGDGIFFVPALAFL